MGLREKDDRYVRLRIFTGFTRAESCLVNGDHELASASVLIRFISGAGAGTGVGLDAADGGCEEGLWGVKSRIGFGADAAAPVCEAGSFGNEFSAEG